MPQAIKICQNCCGAALQHLCPRLWWYNRWFEAKPNKLGYADIDESLYPANMKDDIVCPKTGKYAKGVASPKDT